MLVFFRYVFVEVLDFIAQFKRANLNCSTCGGVSTDPAASLNWHDSKFAFWSWNLHGSVEGDGENDEVYGNVSVVQRTVSVD